MANNISLKGYGEGEMACALETLDEILTYLHREHIFPNFITMLRKDSKKNSVLDELDNQGCTPKCASH